MHDQEHYCIANKPAMHVTLTPPGANMSLLFVTDLEVLLPVKTWVCRSANIYGCCTVEDARCHQDRGVAQR